MIPTDSSNHNITVVCLFALVIYFVLLKTNNFIYFYSKTVSYLLLLFALSFILVPLSLLRPRNLKNYRIGKVLTHFAAWIFQVDAIVHNKEIITQVNTAAIYVANHQSSVDLLGMIHVWPDNCTVLAKKELLIYTGPFGLAMWLIGMEFVDRFNHSKAMDTLHQIACKIKERNMKLWVFPEGTRSKTGSLLPFKKGAFHLAIDAQIPIVPIVFSNYRSFYDPSCYKFTSGTIEATVLPPVPTEGLTTDDMNDLIDRVRTSMCELFEKDPHHKDK